MRYPRLLLLAAPLLFATGGAHAACAERALVSGFTSNNVHVYDACTGAFERLLDAADRIRGPQAVRIGPNGMLYVVSEGNGRVLRYNATTLEFIDSFINAGAGTGITGLAFGPDGDVYLGGYAVDTVRRYDGTTGQLEATVVAAGTGLDGPDCGMNFGPDGRLYIPSYNNNAVVRYDPASNTSATIVAPNTGGLVRTRAVLFEPGGQSYLVTSEGSGHLFRFNAANNALVSTVASGLGGPAGANYMADGKLLIATNDGTAIRVDPATGQNLGPLFPQGRGGLDGSTYAVTIPFAAAPAVDASQIGSQYWIVGAGTMSGRTLNVEGVVSSVGTAFGDGFRAADVVRKRWGRVSIAFTGCRAGNFTWDSTGPDSAGFGTGGYAVSPAVATAFTTQCESAGFANATDDFVNGSWWGGETRSGEGLFLTRSPDGLVALAWFTHRPLQ